MDAVIQLLLADDDKDDCLLFSEVLGELPLLTHLSIAHDGEQLMELLTAAAALPDVLFLDLNMPRKSGFECLAEIKMNAALSALTVVIISTSFRQDIADMLYDHGAHYYIRKPNDFPHFRSVIQEILLLITRTNFSRPAKENFIFSK